MGKLFGNVGTKIKILSYAVFIILAVGSVISGITLIATEGRWSAMFVLLGMLAMFAGPVVAWILCWFLYGIGQLLDDVHVIRSNVYSVKNSQDAIKNSLTRGDISVPQNTNAAYGYGRPDAVSNELPKL